MRKKTTTATKVLKNPNNPNNKHAPKTIDQKMLLKVDIAVRMKRGQSRNFIFESLKSEGRKIAKNTVYTYADELRQEWIEAKNDSYDAHVASQLARLDGMEEKCWSMLDESGKESIKKVLEYSFQVAEDENEDTVGSESEPSDEINTVGRNATPSDENPKVRKIVRRSSEEPERKLISEKIEYVQKYGDIEIMKMIERLWIRRNEILGIAMQTTINVQNNFNQNNLTNIQNQQNNKPISEKFFGNFIIEEDVREGMNAK